MKKTRFLWADDEIELLKPYILFLEEKGYAVECVNNGLDAVEICRGERFDMVFLDEHMPGLSGLETLNEIYSLQPDVPVVMVTKNESEAVMNKAIGRKITDYLIKPVNPSQILMSIKKNLDKKEIISEEISVSYREEFARLNNEINNCRSVSDWVKVYKILTNWEIELTQTQHPMSDLLETQKIEANGVFTKFVRKNYETWIERPENRPLISPDIFKTMVFPLLDSGEKVFFILLDNFRLDQWLAIKNSISEFCVCEDDCFFSILPTATQYARNALFAGLLPKQIAEMHPDLWTDENESESKNRFEEELLRKQLERFKRKETFSYQKIRNNQEGEKVLQHFSKLETNDLNVLVFNFIDMLSHARTDSEMIRELAANEAAYRSLTRSWFLHSSLPDLLEKITEKGYKAVLTTDHGTIQVKNPLKVTSDKNINTNLRYKTGKNLTYDSRKVVEAIRPESFGLPSQHISSRYIFATNDNFFVYSNNYNRYVSHYENTFQHGGISMEEMIVPLIKLSPK